MRGSYIEATLLVAASVVAAAAGLCHPGRTYWSPERDCCLDCTRCEPRVVLRPCEVHRDTVCASLRDLDLDWSWLGPHNQRKPKNHRKIVWRFESVSGEQTTPSTTTEIPAEDYLDDNEDDNRDNVEVRIDKDNVGVATDWQTIVLTMASSAGVLFFVVVAACSCYYTRQWRKLKENMEADVEGLTAKLALMMSQISEIPETTTSVTTDNVRCAYLEQLLAGKSKNVASDTGNVYIQENNNNY